MIYYELDDIFNDQWVYILYVYIHSSVQQQLQNKTLFNSRERLLLGTLDLNNIKWSKTSRTRTIV